MKSVTFDLNGQSYHALTAGDPNKPLLLFLHGFPEYCGAWSEVIAGLHDDWFCVAPDQRGYGKSWRPEGVEHYATKHLVADVAGFIDHFGGGQAAALIGHDWGASVAYATAIRHPQKLARLVVINGVHPAPFQAALAQGGAQSVASQYITWMRKPGAEDALAKDDFSAMFRLFSAKMGLDWLKGDRLRDYKAAWRDADGLGAMLNWYRATPMLVAAPGQPIPQSDLPQWDVENLKIRMPHLLIWGMDDTALLPESRKGLDQFCDDLELVEVAGADHWITHQKPGLISGRIRQFLAA